MNEETPKEAFERLYIYCYPSWYDGSKLMKQNIAKDYCKKIVNAILEEKLDEYPNYENNERVLFYRQVLVEINNHKETP